MENKLVVSGEASETESEDESNYLPKALSATMASSRKGEVIPGEDSESDSETVIYSNVPEKLSAANPLDQSPSKSRKVFETLLIRKLKEDNRQFHKDLEGFTIGTISEASDVLNTTDQELMKSQITLQGALTALRGLNQHSTAIRNKLGDILSSNFLPTINKSVN